MAKKEDPKKAAPKKAGSGGGGKAKKKVPAPARIKRGLFGALFSAGLSGREPWRMVSFPEIWLAR